MGRTNMFIVMIVIVVVGTSFASLQRTAGVMSESMNDYYRQFQIKSLGSFAMNYGIHKLKTGGVILDGEEYVWHTPDFDLMSSSIDSIRFIPGVGDTVQVIPYVKGNYQGMDVTRQSEATLGFNIQQPEEQFAYYMIDDGAGGTMSDSSGYGYDGAMVNMFDDNWVDGVDSYGLDFDGDDDRDDALESAEPENVEVDVDGAHSDEESDSDEDELLTEDLLSELDSDIETGLDVAPDEPHVADEEDVEDTFDIEPDADEPLAEAAAHHRPGEAPAVRQRGVGGRRGGRADVRRSGHRAGHDGGGAAHLSVALPPVRSV